MSPLSSVEPKEESIENNGGLLEDFDKYFRPNLQEERDVEPKAPPRTKKKYSKSKTVDVTRFGVVVMHENDSLENSCSEEADSSKLDFKNVDTIINESIGLRVSPLPSPPSNKDLNDSLEECLNTQATQKDIDFLYEIGTKIDRCPSGGDGNGDDDVVVINECVTFVTTLSKATIITEVSETPQDMFNLNSKSSSSSSLKDSKFERTMSKRPLWDKTPRQEVDLMFHRSPQAKQSK